MSFFVSTPAALASISQIYSTTDQITTGNLVALDNDSPNRVVIADNKSADRLFGVAIPLSIDSKFVKPAVGQVLVATSGSSIRCAMAIRPRLTSFSAALP